MSALASFLVPQLEGLVQRWTARIADGLAPEGLSTPVLRDHIAEVLRELVLTLHHGFVPDTIVYARKHGKQRYQVGFDLDALVREYGVLRGLILELSEEAKLGLTMAEIRLLTDFIAAAIAEAVTEYDQQRAHAEQILTEEVREHEAQLRAVLESTAEGLWGIDTTGRCTFVNPAALRMLGATATSLLGHNLAGLPYFSQGLAGGRSLADAVAEVLRTGLEVRGDDGQMARLDGSAFPARYSVSPLRRDEHLLGAVVTFEDITERRQNERRLAEAQVMNDSALRAGSVATFSWDILSDRLHGNRSFAQLFNVSLDTSPSAPLAEYMDSIHPDDRAATLDKIQQTMNCGGDYEAEFRVVNAGRERWVVARGGVDRDVKGRPLRFLGVIIDIDDRKRAEEAERVARAQVEAERRKLGDLFSQAPVAIAILEGPEHRFSFANPAYRLLVGDRDVVGKSVLEALPELKGQGFDALLDRVVATGEPFLGSEIPVQLDRLGTGKIEEAFLNFTYSPKLDVHGRVDGVLVSAVDVTDQVRARLQVEALVQRLQVSEEQMRLAVDELTRSNRALDQFAHVASHDLRAPLRGIANLATWIEEDLGDAITPDARDKLGLMRGRVQRLESMIAGILDFATAGRGQKAETVDVGELLAEVIELLAPPAHVSMVVGANMPTLVAERVPLQQVFLNLLGNAIKHTHQPGASIRMEVTDEKDRVHFRVIDNGPGIAPENHERIWGIFQRLESKTKVEGTGIGLAVVRKIVESRGGTTWVESVLGQGATFHVLWPKRSSGIVRPTDSTNL